MSGMAAGHEQCASVVKRSCCMMCHLQLASALPQIMALIGTTDEATAAATMTITMTTTFRIKVKLLAPVGSCSFYSSVTTELFSLSIVLVCF